MTGTVPNPGRGDHAPACGPASIRRYGTGPTARRAAISEADRCWAEKTAARAVFRADLGGWAVLVFGPIRS
jgi:hypothetical protein